VDYTTGAGCFCCTTATHFSVYTAVDESTTTSVKDAEAAKATEAVSSATDSSSGDDTGSTTAAGHESGSGMGAIIGGAISGLALIVLAPALLSGTPSQRPTLMKPQTKPTPRRPSSNPDPAGRHPSRWTGLIRIPCRWLRPRTKRLTRCKQAGGEQEALEVATEVQTVSY
jgi:hypothetical protein